MRKKVSFCKIYNSARILNIKKFMLKKIKNLDVLIPDENLKPVIQRYRK